MTNANMARSSILVALLLAVATGVVAQEKVHTVEFYSPAVERTMKYNILLPRDYDLSSERYPVLYLLHGLTQNFTAWGLSNGSPYYAGLYDDLIVVMPDAGNSWYVNWAPNKDGRPNNWEDHIVHDVVNHVDWNFRTIARREGRAIAGLSMGGFGAITLGLRNPEMFISIGSTSGALEHARHFFVFVLVFHVHFKAHPLLAVFFKTFNVAGVQGRREGTGVEFAFHFHAPGFQRGVFDPTEHMLNFHIARVAGREGEKQTQSYQNTSHGYPL